jgi:hypothetical protein
MKNNYLPLQYFTDCRHLTRSESHILSTQVLHSLFLFIPIILDVFVILRLVM